MSKRKIYDFLRDLSANNSKRWMDEHRDRYEEAKGIWTEECGDLITELAKVDDFYEDIEARATVERINNNLLYHPDKPTYKDHFGFAPGDQKGTGIYVSVSPSYSWIGGGVHNPDSEMLKDIRKAIDERGGKLAKIITDKSFVDYFGGLEEDPKMLKTSPKGYGKDHPHIELLRRKDFTVSTRITQEEVLSDGFAGVVVKAYGEMRGLLEFMRGAMK